LASTAAFCHCWEKGQSRKLDGTLVNATDAPEMTGPGLATAAFAWGFVVAFNAFLFLLVLHFAGFVWKSFRNNR
jgi:hypothetical protein